MHQEPANNNHNIVQRCVTWNSLRYDRVFQLQLALKLLAEEQDELSDALFASDRVEVLDACGDIAFVAIGVLWKAGIPVKYIEQYLYECDMGAMDNEHAYAHFTGIMHEITSNLASPESGLSVEAAGAIVQGCYEAVHSLFVTVLRALRTVGVQHRFYDVVSAICTSNDTKEVKGKVAANVKANVVKGAGFVPPTEELKTILAKVH